MNKRAVIYARVSTDTQRDNFSISSQIDECVRYAQKRYYSIVGNQYVDSDTGHDSSGGDGTVAAFVDDFTSRELSRPGLDSALYYLETVGFDILIVHSLDRLARDPYIRQTLEREFNTRGSRVEFVLGNYEETPEGEVRKDLDATFAKWENAKRVERCNRGKRRKAESGLFVAGRSPYGYRIDKNAPGGLAIKESESDVVARIFHFFVNENFSIRQIARILQEEKISPYLGGTEWGKTSIVHILRNTVYVGYCYYNKNKRNGKRLLERDPNDWIRFETPQIVEGWIFNQAQERLKENRTARRVSPSRFYLLTGMVLCDSCNRPYITQTALAGKNRRINDAPYYRHRVAEGHCHNHTISARVLEPEVWDKVAATLLDPERLRRGYFDSLAQQEASKSRQRGLIETFSRSLVKLEKERQNLTSIYIDPDVKMTKIEYLDQKARIEGQMKEILDEIEKTETELASLPSNSDFETLEKFVEKVRLRLANDYEPTPIEKRQIFELLHIKVFIKMDGSMRVDGWFRDNEESGGDEISSGLLPKTLKRYAHQKPPLPGRV